VIQKGFFAILPRSRSSAVWLDGFLGLGRVSWNLAPADADASSFGPFKVWPRSAYVLLNSSNLSILCYVLVVQAQLFRPRADASDVSATITLQLVTRRITLL
jgi:hypothetical protein